MRGTAWIGALLVHFESVGRRFVRHLVARPIDLRSVFPVMLVLCVVVFARSLWSNFIFDEQEALLANPYVNGHDLGFWDAFRRDFWGLPPTRSIGSYRPLPNLIWRVLWVLREHPWPAHAVNMVVHALNASLVCVVSWHWFGRRGLAWLCGAILLFCGPLTETVCGVVGLADVLGGCAALVSLLALRWRLGLAAPAVCLAVFLGFLSKESSLVLVPLLPWAAWISAGVLHPGAPRRWLRAGSIALASVAALVAYAYFRRHFFPVELPESLRQPLPLDEPLPKRVLHEFLRWFQQPRLPVDPINNPLAMAEPRERVLGALRVFWHGLTQVVWPWPLSGDYSYSQETAPAPGRYPLASLLGGAALGLGPWLGAAAALRLVWLERRGRVEHRGAWLTVALVAVWVPVAYFPHSNIAVLLPTVRAERFWYIPAISTSLALGYLWVGLLTRLRSWRDRTPAVSNRRWRWAVAACVAAAAGFVLMHALAARLHAFDYSDDLAFWGATSRTSPRSAKAHLNYGVMLGARGDTAGRKRENQLAMELAPNWPMAHVYYGDVLCRKEDPVAAWPHYRRGFELGPDEQSLIALALQCLWDKQQIPDLREELLELSGAHPGSWLSYLASDVVYNGERYGGVDPKHRPRGYDQGVDE